MVPLHHRGYRRDRGARPSVARWRNIDNWGRGCLIAAVPAFFELPATDLVVQGREETGAGTKQEQIALEILNDVHSTNADRE